jgi:hypothetical protein
MVVHRAIELLVDSIFCGALDQRVLLCGGKGLRDSVA